MGKQTDRINELTAAMERKRGERDASARLCARAVLDGQLEAASSFARQMAGEDDELGALWAELNAAAAANRAEARARGDKWIAEDDERRAELGLDPR